MSGPRELADYHAQVLEKEKHGRNVRTPRRVEAAPRLAVDAGMPEVVLIGNCRVLVGQEPQGWHLSISCPNRNPTWEEIKQARYDLLPHDVTMAMILPPTEEYINIHNFCFHLHQLPNEE